jgi:hypothetical protein
MEEFKREEYYEMIIKWDLNLLPKHPFEYQRLGFKSNKGIAEATRHAEQLTNLIGRATRKTLDKDNPAKLIAMYRRNAFKDWSGDPYNRVGNIHKFIKDKIKEIEKKKKQNKKGKKTKPITFVKEVMIVR